MISDKLRKSILLEAISGRLTEKINYNDNMNELLSDITIDENLLSNLNFEFPDNWKTLKLSDMFLVERGGSPRPIKSFLTEKSNGVNWIKIGDSEKNGKYINSTKEKIIPEGIKNSRKVYKGDLLLTNSMSFGRPYILNCDGCIHDGWLVLHPKYKEYINVEFFYYLLSSDFMFSQFSEKADGGVVNNLNIKKAESSIIVVPPIEEQDHIVQKIETIIPLLDSLKELEVVANEMDISFSDKLSKSVIHEAMKGTLTIEEDSTESVIKYIEKVNSRKKDLINAKKIRRRPEAKPITSEVIPFDIPNHWEWIRFNDLVQFHMGKTPPRAESINWGDYMSWISIADINSKLVSTTKEKVSKHAIDNNFGGIISKKGTLIMSFKLSIGKTAILDIDAVHNEAIISITPFVDKNNILRNYLLHILPVVSLWGDSKSAVMGRTLNATSISNLLIPLPPFEEQKMIVEKLESLFEEIDTLSEVLD